jgi:hypothetical protein
VEPRLNTTPTINIAQVRLIQTKFGAGKADILFLACGFGRRQNDRHH